MIALGEGCNQPKSVISAAEELPAPHQGVLRAFFGSYKAIVEKEFSFHTLKVLSDDLTYLFALVSFHKIRGQFEFFFILRRWGGDSYENN